MSLFRMMKDPTGTVAFVFIAGTLPLFLVIFLSVNSSKATFDALRAQDAADMIALAHAAEAARGLNVIAMNQVSTTQNYTTAVNSSSLYNTSIAHMALLGLAMGEAAMYATKTCAKWKFLAPICAIPSVTYATELGQEVWLTNSILRKYKPKQALETAKAALKTTDAQNAAIFNRFPDVVRQQGMQIAQEFAITDFHLDRTCQPGRAASCSTSTLRQGMDLPVTRNEPKAIYPTFCAALYFGTGGVDLRKIPFLGSVSSSFSGLTSVPLVHGSFEKRGFPIGSGPMYGGSSSDPYLPVHISKKSEIGERLSHYQEISQEKRLFDGILNFWATGPAVASSVVRIFARKALGLSTRKHERRLEGSVRRALKAPYKVVIGHSTKSYTGVPLASSYPFNQTLESNVFTKMVEFRVLAKCSGAGLASGLSGAGLGAFFESIGIVTTVPKFDLYHPVTNANEGWVPKPKILPSLEDFPLEYQPLALTLRRPNDRWANTYFRVHQQGYFKYAQAITYNPEEISLYNQNWGSRLVPASRMKDLQGIQQDLELNAPQAFAPFENLFRRLTPGEREEWHNAVIR